MQPNTATYGVGGATALSLARVELKAGLRGGAFRFFAVLAFILGWSTGSAPGDGVGLSAYSAGQAGWLYMGFLTIGWMSVMAVRDFSLRTDILIFSKPQPTERLILSRFLAAFGQALMALAAMFLGAIIGRLYSYGGISGLPAYGLQFARVACVLYFAASLSFSLALLANSSIVGAIAGLIWVTIVAGKEYLAKIFFPSYAQNLLFYMLVSTAILCLCMLFHRRGRRGSAPSAFMVRAALPLSLAAAGAVLWINIRDGYDPAVRTQIVLDEFQQQNAVLNMLAPGFLLPDQNGKLTSLSDFPNSILIIALWSPENQETASMFSLLKMLQSKFAGKNVQPIAICISEDSSAAATFARGEGVSFPVVLDWGTHNAPKTSEMSPLTDAYQADFLPTVVITDRRRRIKRMIKDSKAYDGTEIEQVVNELLAAEPE